MKLGVVTAVYPGVEGYFPDCLASLEQQTDQDFLTVVADAGMPGFDDLVKGYAGRIEVCKCSGSPVQVRKQMIASALAVGCEQIVFLDADDCAATDRIEKNRVALQNAALVFNDLELFGAEIKHSVSMLSQHYRDGQACGLEEVIHKNFLGLTNTAANADVLRPIYELPPDDLVAYDWALYSLALLDGARAKFVASTSTRYRQYAANTASLVDYTDAQILRSVGVKAQHYAFMARHSGRFASLADEFGELRNTLAENVPFAEKYSEQVRKQKYEKMPLWWEATKLYEELQ